MSVLPANSRRRTIDAPHPAQAKGAVWLPERGERRLFSVPGAGGDWRWRWGLPLPLPQGWEGVARQKIAVFPAAPCRRVGSRKRLARPRGERRCGTGSHPQGEGVPRRSAEGLFGSCWGRNGEQAPSCSRLPRRGGNSWSLGRRAVRYGGYRASKGELGAVKPYPTLSELR